jgi:hypothetical protein
MVFFSRVGNRHEKFRKHRIMSSAEGGLSDANNEGAPAGAAGGTAIQVAVGKRVRQQTAKVKAALTDTE